MTSTTVSRFYTDPPRGRFSPEYSQALCYAVTLVTTQLERLRTGPAGIKNPSF